TGNAITEPENLADAEIIAQTLLDYIAGQIRIPIVVQQTRLGREQRAAAVHFDGAAFENHSRIENRQLQDFSNTRWHNLIEIKWRIFISPGIVIPVHNG